LLRYLRDKTQQSAKTALTIHETDEFGSMLYFHIQISQGREAIPIADKIPESACQVVVANVTAKGEFIICHKSTTSHKPGWL